MIVHKGTRSNVRPDSNVHTADQHRGDLHVSQVDRDEMWFIAIWMDSC